MQRGPRPGPRRGAAAPAFGSAFVRLGTASLIALLALGGSGCRSGRAVGRGDGQQAPAGGVRFTDVTTAAGIHFRQQNSKTPRKYFVETMGSGGAFIDADGDGWQDVLLLNGAPLPGGHVAGRPTMALYRNNQDGTFTDVTHAAGLDRQLMYGMGIAVGDYDNDGRDDFYVTCVLGPSHLFRNDTRPGGAPRFTDVTTEAGVANKGRWGTSCAWLDDDRDGRLDLFVCNYVRYASLADDQPCFSDGNQHRIYCIPAAYEPSHCVLYHNDGSGHFEDVSVASGIGAAPGKSLGVTVWDYDDDGWPDVFVANDTTPGFLFHNVPGRGGRRAFQEIGAESGVAYDEDGNTHSGMGIDAANLLDDGKTWLGIANFQGQETSLYQERAAGEFEDQHRAAGVGPATAGVLGFGLLFFDYDNDGYPDLFQVNGHVQDEIHERQPQVRYRQPALLFHNQRDGTFVEVGRRSGRPFAQPIVGRGCAWGDVGNDGRPDLLVTTNNGPALLWRNETATSNHWLTLRLAGTRSDRDGIGAWVKVTTGGVTQRLFVHSGSSYLSQSDLRPHFGLGPSTTANVEVRWPSGAIDRIASLPGDRIWTIREGKGRVP